MARIKWINHNVDLKRGTHAAVIVKFNNSPHWFEVMGCCTTQTAKAAAKNLAEYMGATQVEIKNKLDEEAITYYTMTNDNGDMYYKFRIEHDVPEGAKRQFTYFKQEDLFIA